MNPHPQPAIAKGEVHPSPPSPLPSGERGTRGLLTRPEDFADGPIATAWFHRIADTLLNRSVLRIAGKPHRLAEVEVYYHGPGHADVFAHRDPVQLHAGRWYFHKTRGTYRGGSFKGLDLAFGDGTAHGGVLFRGLEAPDGNFVDGPSLLVDHILKTSGFATIAELDAVIDNRLAWDDSQPLVLVPADSPIDRPILKTARVGLSLKHRKPKPADPALSFVLRPYRYLTEPRRTAKGKPHMVLSLHASGEPAGAITAKTGCPLATVKRYTAAFDSGRTETDVAAAAFYGMDLSTAKFARFHGLLSADPCDSQPY